MIERLFTKPHLAGVRLNSLQWSPDGTRLTFLRALAESDAQDLWCWDASGGEARPLLRVENLLAGAQFFSRDEELVRERTRQTAAGITRYLWHPDGSSLFIPLNGDVYKYSFSDSAVRRLTREREAEFDLQVSPSGDRLSYVRSGEVYVFDLSSGRERRLTHDAGGSVRNGVSEFVAQEEMGRTTGVWWSPDGRSLAFLQVDTAPVGVFHIPNFMAPETAVARQEYPKAGEANATVRLGVLTAAGGDPHWLRYQEREDDYLARVDWFPDGRHLAIQVQSRDQKELRLLAVDVAGGGTKIVLQERDDSWVSLHNNFRMLPDGRHFVWSSERTGFQHLYLYAIDGTLIRQLTRGSWDVDRVLHVDAAAGTVFFTAPVEGATERHVCTVPLAGGEVRRLTAAPGWHDAAIAPDGKRIALISSRLMEPPRLEVRSEAGEEPRVLEPNVPVALRTLDLPQAEYFALRNRAGDELNALTIKPQGFNAQRRYPVIMYVYGGPTVQVVADQWGAMGGWQRTVWHHMMAHRGYLVVCVDGRGTPGRGRAFQNVVQGALGRAELEDQLDAAAWLRTQPFVDPARIMLWGKSYGGFMACMAACTAPERFRLCIAVAPVTDWRNYDTHYTERYMGTPAGNPEGYRACSPVHHAPGLGTRFLLVHGVVDDNVHFQDSMLLADALQRANKRFDFMAYPRSTHAFSGDDVGLHLYSTLAAYITEHL